MYRALIAVASLVVSGAACADSRLALEPGFSVAGQSDEQLTASWWQWAYAQPGARNPVVDQTGTHCGVGQSGPVWFLAGGFGSARIKRRCVVPASKILFFPLVNMVYFPEQEGDGSRCHDAIRNAAYNNERAIDLFVEVDGVEVKGLERHRIRSRTCFNILARVDPARQPYNAYPSASDGFWMALQPLSQGRHNIKFGGRYNQRSSSYGNMVQDIEYEIIVN